MFKWSKYDAIILPIVLLIIIIISKLIQISLRGKDEKTKIIPLKIITIIMLIMEIIKQVKDIIDGYDMWTFPLHFCSLFLYFFPLAVFAKGKFQDFGKTMSLVCPIMMTIAFYVSPGGIIGNSSSELLSNFSAFHSFTYHHLVILFLFVSLFTNFYSFKKENYKYVLIGFITYALLVIPAAHLLNTNYCEMLHSSINFLESFRLFAGQFTYTLLVFTIFLVGGTFLVFIHGKITSKQKMVENKNKISKTS